MKLEYLLPNRFIFFLTFFFSLFVQGQIELNTNVTAEEMVENLLMQEMPFFNASYIGAPLASGTFNDGLSDDFGLYSGIFLTNGEYYNIPGPNISYNSTVAHALPGDTLLSLVFGDTTYDASILKFHCIPPHD